MNDYSRSQGLRNCVLADYNNTGLLFKGLQLPAQNMYMKLEILIKFIFMRNIHLNLADTKLQTASYSILYTGTNAFFSPVHTMFF